MRTVKFTRRSEEQRPTRGAGCTCASAVELTVACGVPNKPMVLTAHTAPKELPPAFAPRRHIGQPFGSCDERGGFVFDEITARA